MNNPILPHRPAALPSLIAKAWAARFTRDLETCRILVAALRQKMSFLTRAFDEAHLENLCLYHRKENVADVICLIASLQRADGEMSASQASLDVLERFFHLQGWAIPFQLCFQKGLNEYAEANFSEALDLFLAAKSAGVTAVEKSYALSNALFCLEALAMPYSKTREELQSTLAKVPAQVSAVEIVDQLEAFDLRNSFRQGQIAHLMKPRPPKKYSTQADYYLLWVSELPYHAMSGGVQPEVKERFFLAEPHFYQKTYRTRTLQGFLHEEDLKKPKETELADRIYLWTWRWLTGAESPTIPRIMALLRNVDLVEVTSRLSCEDYQLMRNSLMWLSLFDANSAAAVRKIAEALRPVHAEDFLLFSFERDVINYLCAVRDRRAAEAHDLYLMLKGHPLWHSADIKLGDLVRALNDETDLTGPLKNLLVQIRQFNDTHKSNTDGVTVDLKSYEVTSGPSRKKVVSQPLCLAIESLFRKNPLDFEELLRICFGTSQYDPLSHASKIFNLIARMKACLPEEIILHTKSGKLYATGSWAKVAFINPHPLATGLQSQPEWRALIRRRIEIKADLQGQWLKPAQILKKLSGQTQMRRHELEALTGKSRSTANRIISRWLSQGVIRKTGRAKNTVYIFRSTQDSIHKKT